MCYSEPFEDDIEGQDYDYGEAITIDWLLQVLPSSFLNGRFYIFSNPEISRELAFDLVQNGVLGMKIHYEQYASSYIPRKKKLVAKQLQKDEKNYSFLKETIRERKVHKKVRKVWEKKADEWLSEDAGRPGPLEWFVIYFVPLLKCAQQTIGLYFITIIHLFDSILKLVTNYVYNIYYSWKMMWAIKRKHHKQKSTTNILANNVLFARMALSKSFRFRGFDLERHRQLLTQKQWQKLTKPNFAIKEVLEIRRHLEEMYVDLDILTDEQILQTTKKSMRSFILSYIPDPFELFHICKDWFLIAFVIRYRREDIEKKYIDFVYAYQHLVPIVEKNTSNILANNDYEKTLTRYASSQILPKTVENHISYSKKQLLNILRILCNPQHVLVARKWRRSDLLREVITWEDNGCHPDYIHELENYLLKEVKAALLAQGAKTEEKQQITKIIRRRKAKLYEELEQKHFYVYFTKLGQNRKCYVENTSILELIEENGITVDSGCRFGNCHVCLLPLKQGKIRYTHDVCTDGIPKGYFLPCSAVPDGDIVIDL